MFSQYFMIHPYYVAISDFGTSRKPQDIWLVEKGDVLMFLDERLNPTNGYQWYLRCLKNDAEVVVHRNNVNMLLKPYLLPKCNRIWADINGS